MIVDITKFTDTELVDMLIREVKDRSLGKANVVTGVRDELLQRLTKRAADGACPHCKENDWRECIHGVFCGYCHSPRR